MPASEPLEINQSKLGMFQKCPEQYRRRYVEGDIIPPPWAFVRGSAVHKGAEHNFTQKVETHEDLPADEVIAVAIDTARTKIKNEGLAVADGENRDIVINEGEHQIIRLARALMECTAGNYQPRAVEEKIEAMYLPVGQPPVKVHGTLDVIATHAVLSRGEHEGEDVIPDFKTKSKRGTIAEYEASLQATMYAMLYTHKFKKPPLAVVFEELIDTKQTGVATFDTRRNEDDFEALLLTVGRTAAAIRAGAFTGAYGQFGAWWCSRESCGYWRTCPFVPKHRR